MAKKKFKNPRYEYMTREYPYEGRAIEESKVEAELEPHGWSRIYADNTITGSFVVYRRPRA